MLSEKRLEEPISHPGHRIKYSRKILLFHPPIAVVINIFRLPDLLTNKMVVCNGLKLLQT
jgi:hypothetical protein